MGEGALHIVFCLHLVYGRVLGVGVFYGAMHILTYV